LDWVVVAVTVIAVYDVASDSRRSRVAALLQAHGDRVQRSVFVLEVAADEMASLVDRVREILDVDADSFYVFRQCGGCWEELVCVGQASPPADAPYWAVL
jgi:CRISPR-associated protein Cas2